MTNTIDLNQMQKTKQLKVPQDQKLERKKKLRFLTLQKKVKCLVALT